MKALSASRRPRLAILAGFLFVACGALPRTPTLANTPAPAEIPAVAQARATAPPDTLFVVRRGWHIDVGFAVDELTEPLSAMVAGFPGARYLLFGFGDRRYLTAKHRGAPVLLRALWPGPGLLLVTGLRATPAAAFGDANVIALATSREAALRAQSFIWQALTDHQQSEILASENGGHAAIGFPGPYEGSAFFDSRTTYSAVHTCNTWAAEVLKISGFAVHSRGILFAGQLWGQIRRAAQKLAPALPREAVAPTRPFQTKPAG